MTFDKIYSGKKYEVVFHYNQYIVRMKNGCGVKWLSYNKDEAIKICKRYDNEI